MSLVCTYCRAYIFVQRSYMKQILMQIFISEWIMKIKWVRNLYCYRKWHRLANVPVRCLQLLVYLRMAAFLNWAHSEINIHTQVKQGSVIYLWHTSVTQVSSPSHSDVTATPQWLHGYFKVMSQLLLSEFGVSPRWRSSCSKVALQLAHWCSEP